MALTASPATAGRPRIGGSDRRLGRMNETTTAKPAGAAEPGACRCHWRCHVRGRPNVGPPTEPSCGRVRIESHRGANMFPEVVEDVHECIADLAWRAESTSVVSVGPNSAVTPERTVQPLRDADREALHTAHEPRWPIRFHQQMQMIPLNGERENTEACRVRCPESGSENLKKPFVSEGRDVRARPEGHVDGTAGVVRGAGIVRDEASSRCGLTSGILPCATPCVGAKL